MKKILFSAAVLVSALLSASAFAGGDIEAGKAAVKAHNCAACHGADLNSPIDPT